MKQIWISFSLLLLTLAAGAQTSTRQHKVDSLYQLIPSMDTEEKLETYEKLLKWMTSSPDTAMTLNLSREMYREALKSNNKKWEARARCMELIFYGNQRMFDEYDALWEELRNFTRDNEAWTEFYSIYLHTAGYYLEREKPEKAIELADEVYEIAKENKHKQGLAISAYLHGRFLNNQDRNQEAESYYLEAEKYFQEVDYKYLLKETYQRLASTYIWTEKDKEFFSTMQKWEETIREQMAEDPEDSLDPEWNTLYNIYFGYYLTRKDWNKAEEYLLKSEKHISPSLPIEVIKYVGSKADLYFRMGNNQKALDALDEMMETVTRVDVQGVEALIWNFRTEIYEAMGQYKEALDAYRSMRILQDSTDNVAINTKLNEAHTRYEVEKHIAEKEKRQVQVVWAVISCALLLIALLIYALYSRRLKQRNLALYQQVQELSRKEKAVENCFLSKPKETLSKEMLLFRRLNECMKTEKLFANTDINRKTVADHLGTNENYLANAIRQGRAETFSDYISNLRLQYAIELMEGHPEMTFDSIAVDSGHGSYSQFFRSFSKKYGISPSEYRKMSAKKNKPL